jgi:hypothetical protein
MKKTSIAMFLCLLASFILPSCEKAVIDEYPQMEAYYVESKGLSSVTIDSVRTFSSKVDGFVTTYPIAKEHEKYPLIQANIKSASLRIAITVNDEWAGDTIIHF